MLLGTLDPAGGRQGAHSHEQMGGRAPNCHRPLSRVGGLVEGWGRGQVPVGTSDQCEHKPIVLEVYSDPQGKVAFLSQKVNRRLGT